MAVQFRLLPQIQILSSSLHQFRSYKFLCADGQYLPEIGEETADDQIRKLSVYLEQGRTNAVKSLIKSLLQQSDSPFISSPSDLFSFFCSSCAPSLKSTFSKTLLSVCAESKLPEEAVVELYTSIIKEGFFPSLSSLNLLLQSLVSSGQYAKALHFFTHIIVSGIRVDNFTYRKAVHSAVKLGDLKKGVDLMNDMERPDCLVYSVLIDGFCKEKRMVEAQKLFDEMLERKVAADCVAYTTLIDGYCKAENMNEAQRLFDEMLGRKVAANCVTYTTLIDGYCKSGNMNEAQRLFDEMFGRKVAANCVTYNTLINGYFKVGNMSEGLNVLEKMKRENVHTDLVTYSTIIDGYCKVGNMSEALNVLEKMKTDNVQPNLVTYNTLIDGYFKVGNMSEALNVLEKMKTENVQPDLVTYNTMIDGYCKLGNLNEAVNVREKMKAENVQPDLVTFNSLLSGLSRSRKMEDARKLLQKAKETFDDLKARGLISGANTYIKLINGHCNIEDFDGGYVCYRKKLDNGFLPDKRTCNELVTGLRKVGMLQETERICSEMSNTKGVL